MTGRSHQRAARALLVALVLGIFALGSVGCEKSNEERLLTAKAAVLNNKPDLAESNLEVVLGADPDNFEAKRLSAAVQELRGNFADAEKQFLELQEAEGFQIGEAKQQAADEGEPEEEKLSAEQKSRRELLKRDMLDLYQNWADSLDPSEDIEALERAAEKGLAIAPSRPRLNSLLVDAYEEHAKKLIEQGKKVEAAELYEKIPKLYTSSSTRKRVTERASNLRFEAGRAEMLDYFNESAKSQMIEDERFDEDKEVISFTVVQPVREVEAYILEKQEQQVRLDPRQEGAQAIVHDFALSQKVRPALVELIVEATGVPEDADFSEVRPPDTFQITSAEPSRTDYTISATLPLDAVLKMGFDVREQTRLAAQKKAEAPAAEQAEQEAADGDKAADDEADQGDKEEE